MDTQTICLIIPPSPFLLDERVFVSLGILKVAAALEQSGRRVEMLDLSGVANYEAVARAHVLQSAASIFGLTATTPQMPAAMNIVAAIRLAKPGSRIVLGGPHATLVHASWKRERKLGLAGRGLRAFEILQNEFDVIVAGDGEKAVLYALDDHPPALIDADDPSSDFFLNNDALNESPWPARHLVDMESYHYSIEGHRATSAIFQLGCPFTCGFCGGRLSPMLRRIRMRSIANVVAEIAHLYRVYGYTGINAYDDELNVNPQMVTLMLAIAELQTKLAVEMRLRGFIKSQLFCDEQAEALYRAGFRWILVGFESGSERILLNMNKKATRADNTRCIEIAKRHGLKVKALMSIGHPGESAETVRETQEWLLATKPDDFDATIITTYPGSPYYDQAIQSDTDPSLWTYTCHANGDRLYAREVDFVHESAYYKGVPGEYVSYVFTDHLSADDLVQLRDDLENEVRSKLNLPFNPSAAAVQFEHSMGQPGPLPARILKVSA